MKKLILTSLISAAAVLAQSSSTAPATQVKPQAAPAAPAAPAQADSKAPVKKHRKHKKNENTNTSATPVAKDSKVPAAKAPAPAATK